MFSRLGHLIGRRPFVIILVWMVIVAVGAIWAGRVGEAPLGEVDSFLPAESAHNRGVALSRAAFPHLAYRSQLVVIGHRPGGLTSDDYAWLGKVAEKTEQVMRDLNVTRKWGGDSDSMLVLSPEVPFFKPRLVSPNGEAAMVVANLPFNFISVGAQSVVKAVEDRAVVDPPEGLAVEITGTAGMGRDVTAHTKEALHRTTWVTIVAVLVILVLIYRSPLGALVPLVSIGASVFLAFVVLARLAFAGWTVSDMDRIFAVVLLFGAGVDYALFWISRYREAQERTSDLKAASVEATRGAGPSILASAATTICGLSCMVLTDLVPTQTAGQVLAIVLLISLAAALTLAPAMARVMRGALFWPVGATGRPGVSQRVVWPKLANGVIRSPLTCLSIGTLVLGSLAVRAIFIEPRFDALSQVPVDSSSQRGFEIAEEHFSEGQLYSNSLLLKFPDAAPARDELHQISETLSDRIARLDGVYDVYALDAPLGHERDADSAILDSLLSNVADKFYVSESPAVLRSEVLIDHMPFSPQAMSIVDQVENIARDVADEHGAEVFLTGPTSYVIGVREVAGRDLRLVMILATAVIALIVLLLIRHVALTLFMLLATWLTFGATLELSHLFFVHVMHAGGLDWKVRLIVFVIVVAVGQDYNIFLVTRLMQERARVDDAEATRRAIVSTGSVISSCGIIMAATLGSLWAGGLSLLRQIGFTLALGILIDTFFVRPLLIPSFFLALNRRRGQPTTVHAPPTSERSSRRRAGAEDD